MRIRSAAKSWFNSAIVASNAAMRVAASIIRCPAPMIRGNFEGDGAAGATAF